MEEEVHYRVGWISAGIMLGIAIVADLLQAFLTFTLAFAVASDIVTIIAESCIFFYFWICGVHFTRGKGSFGRLMGFFVTTAIEMVPIVDALPTLTFDTLYNIHSARKADRQLFKEQQEQKQAKLVLQRAQEEQVARYYAQQANDNQEPEEYQQAA